MRYLNAWVVRFCNRIILVLIAMGTVAWMAYLLDINQASVREKHIQSVQKQKILDEADQIDNHIQHKRNQELNIATSNIVKQQAQQHDFKQELPVPNLQQPIIKQENIARDPSKTTPPQAIKREQPRVAEKPSKIKKPSGRPVNQIQNRTNPVPPGKGVGKSTTAAGKTVVAKPAKANATVRKTNVVKGVDKKLPTNVSSKKVATIEWGTGKVVELYVLQQCHLADIEKMGPLPILTATKNSCFCATSSGDTTNAITPEEAVQLGCPQQENLELRCLPGFYVVGCNSCGVTDLLFRLNKHQLINFGTKKDPEFWTGRFMSKFAGTDGITDTLAAYSTFQYSTATHAVLQAIREGRKLSLPLIGEYAPTMYSSMIGSWHAGGLSGPAALARIIPDARIVFMLRDPVMRTHSQLQELVPQTERNADTFDEHVNTFIAWYEKCTIQLKYKPEECMYGKVGAKGIRPTKQAVHDIINSLYDIAVQEWIDVFGKDKMLVLKFEDYVTDRLKTIQQKVLPFLSLKDYTAQPLGLLKEKENDNTFLKETQITVEMHDYTKQKLTEFFKPHLQILSAVTGDAALMWE